MLVVAAVVASCFLKSFPGQQLVYYVEHKRCSEKTIKDSKSPLLQRKVMTVVGYRLAGRHDIFEITWRKVVQCRVLAT